MRICIDLDGVICQLKKGNEKYENLKPVAGAKKKLKKLKQAGNYIIIYTARNMKTCNANIGLVNANIAKITLDWLEKNDITFDEIYFGKPWCDIYIDDNAFRFKDWNDIKDNGDNLPKSSENLIKESKTL